MKRRVLIVSPHFPPTNAPDHQRARQCLRYLGDHGWEAEVLAVDPAYVEAPQDPMLIDALPAGSMVHRVPALPLRLARKFGVGSLGLRAYGPLRRAGNRLLQQRRFDLVFFSTTQFLVTTMGYGWKRRLGIPYVLDWQDPWVTDYYDRPEAPRPPGGWKYAFARWQAELCEPRCIRNAAGLVATSPLYLTQLAERYPEVTHLPSATIPFGADPADFEAAGRADLVPAFVRQPSVRHFAFVGAVGPIMADALGALFQGLRHWTEHSSAHRQTVRFHFIGTSYADRERAEFTVLPIAQRHGVADLIEEQPGRIGYFPALRTILAADALLLLGSNDSAYSPSKLATLALTGKPILAVIPGGGQLDAHLAALGGIAVARFSPIPEIQRVAEFIERPASPGICAHPDRWSAQARTAELCSLFDRALSIPSGLPEASNTDIVPPTVSSSE